MSKSYSLPLVIKPDNGKRSVEDLKQWIATNKDVLDENLENHGEQCYTACHCYNNY